MSSHSGVSSDVPNAYSLWAKLIEELSKSPIASVAGIFAIIAGLFTFYQILRSVLNKRRAKSVLAEFKPAELANRRKVFGRDMAVEEPRAVLTRSGRGAVVPVQTGIGGVGKTTLARHYAKVYAESYDRIEFLRAGTEQDLIRDLAALAKRLDPTLDETNGAHALALCAKDMIADKAGSASWLLIFDNVDQPQLMLDWMIRARNLHTLVTSRFPDWQADGFEAKPLGVLNPDAAQDLLRNEAGRDDPGLADLAEDLGYLPLALVQAGEWLRANPRRSVAEYTAKIDNLRERVDVPSLVTSADRTTAAVVELTLMTLSRDARALAKVMAWYAPDALSEDLFSGLADKPALTRVFSSFVRKISGRVWRVARDETRLRAGFAELRRMALLEDVEDAPGVFRMHRVFQRVIRAQDARRGVPRFAMAESAAAVLAAQFPGGENSPALVHTWPTCRRLLPHLRALWSGAEPLWRGDWGQPGWAAMDYLLNQAGVFLSKQSDLAGAVALKRAGLELKEARLGEEDRDIPAALGNLAIDLAQLGDLAEAQAMIDRAVALGEAHRTGAARADLAGSYMQQASAGFRRMQAREAGAAPQALAALEKARVIWEELFGAQSAEMANWWNQMGYYHNLLGEKSAKLAAYDQSLRLTRALPQADKAELATQAMNVGSTALELGRVDEAEAPLREAYQIAAEIYAEVPNHPFLQATAQWLTACLFVLARKGQGTEAEARQICARHGLNAEALKARAAQFPLEPVQLW